MFIKRKTTAGKVYAYRMVVSFKMLVYFLTSHRTTVSVLLSLDITRFFAGHCRMPCANIQACNKLYQTIRLYHKLHYDVYPSIEVLLNEDEKTIVLGTIHIWRPWKLSNFQGPPPPPPPPPPLAQLRPTFFHLLDLGRPISSESPLPL